MICPVFSCRIIQPRAEIVSRRGGRGSRSGNSPTHESGRDGLVRLRPSQSVGPPPGSEPHTEAHATRPGCRSDRRAPGPGPSQHGTGAWRGESAASCAERAPCWPGPRPGLRAHTACRRGASRSPGCRRGPVRSLDCGRTHSRRDRLAAALSVSPASARSWGRRSWSVRTLRFERPRASGE